MRLAIIIQGDELPGRLLDVDGTLYRLGGEGRGLLIPATKEGGERMTSRELAESIASGLGNGTVAEGVVVILPEGTAATA